MSEVNDPLIAFSDYMLIADITLGIKVHKINSFIDNISWGI
ncbi:hypothetical protein Xbud_03050 [Xenorhabdus budapestensis]|uniref:Uncharacterized protein n=1 Tax=Xenorhabdus budapestensis TaxID=290110 RepID=A0A2D0ITC2_XENBU|nr:hypothetical protein Xbud_03050 [Xenorhabdus budapestensis]